MKNVMKKVGSCIILFFCIMLGENICYAAPNKVIGTAVNTDITAYINGFPIPSYNIKGYTGIVVEDLEQYGFDIKYDNQYRTLRIEYNEEKEITAPNQIPKKTIGSVAANLYQTDIVTQIHNENVTSYNIGGKTLILIDSLKYYGNVIWYPDEKKICFDYVPNWTLQIEQQQQKDTSKKISGFTVMWNRNNNGEFKITGENYHYLDNFAMTYDRENGNTFGFSIYQRVMSETGDLRHTLNAMINQDREGNIIQTGINFVNQNMKVSINGKPAWIKFVKEGGGNGHSDYYFYLEKEFRDLDDIKTIKIECLPKEQIKTIENEYQEVVQSTYHKNSYFAEKNNMLYYFKNIGIEKKTPQLFCYDFKTRKETNLSQDTFENVTEIRVCNDGYVYFKGISIYDEYRKKQYYRIPVNGGKSEAVGEHISLLSDTWAYDSEKNTFCNLVSKEVIKNTITQKLNIETIFQIIERNDTIYIYTASINDDSKILYKNGQTVEKGVYALPLYHQSDFYKIPLEEGTENFITRIEVYHNKLYYGILENNEDIKSCYKCYSFETGETSTILEKESIDINDFVIYNDILYFSMYSNMYGISLSHADAEAFIVFDLGEKQEFLHIFENIICHVQSKLLSKAGPTVLENWEINNYRTGENYSITPYTDYQ